MIQQLNCRLPLLSAAQLPHRTARFTADKSSSGPRVRLIYGSPLCMVIGILEIWVSDVFYRKICAAVACRHVTRYLPLLFV